MQGNLDNYLKSRQLLCKHLKADDLTSMVNPILNSRIPHIGTQVRTWHINLLFESIVKRSVVMNQATDMFVTASYGEMCQEKKQKKSNSCGMSSFGEHYSRLT